MDSETRALRRTAIVLLAVSAVRWGWAEGRVGPADLGEPAALPALLDSSAVAAAEAAERARPLGLGERIDPNRADAVQLDRLGGVGPATAAEIVAERDRNGPFATIEELTRVRGIGRSTVEKLRPHLVIGAVGGLSGTRRGATAQLIDVNRADSTALTRLPGVGPALASRILEARRQRPFTALDDLLRVRGIGAVTLERLRAHAVAGRGR